MFFTYPAATTSLIVFGSRWCSKLYLRNAWVSSPNAAFRAASDAFESGAATAGCSVAGAASVFSPWAGSVFEAGVGREVSGDFPQPARRITTNHGRTTRDNMQEIDQSISKIQAARLPESGSVHACGPIVNSATRRTGRMDCNHDVSAGFAAAHG
jgi:hypothetical protein